MVEYMYTLEGAVEVLFYSSLFLVQFVETPRAVSLEQRLIKLAIASLKPTTYHTCRFPVISLSATELLAGGCP